MAGFDQCYQENNVATYYDIKSRVPERKRKEEEIATDGNQKL